MGELWNNEVVGIRGGWGRFGITEWEGGSFGITEWEEGSFGITEWGTLVSSIAIFAYYVNIC